MAGRIAVVGVPADGAPLAGPAAAALAAAEVVVGGRRHLSALAPTGARTLPVESDVASVLDAVAAEPGPVCVLASGDPGFFGILRSLSARFGSGRLDVHPAVSSVAVAFARLGLSWDDAVVVSAHGRPLDDAAAALRGVDKAAVLVSPDSPPEALGKALLASGPEVGAAYEVAVCSRLGTSAESVVRTDLPGLAAGTWDPLSVVLLHRPEAAGLHAPTLAW
ncbi:MAG TPA: precorrin-6y C5,15-methyltransferase (decarboxylating) subunit CbiE, partial [Acidimicrobiales bacterium]|nr:precorrin-6y C5,15-methyltransferase (decarboxylating) subunit CbiE [Acidimicrobiales bacterium]